MLKALTKYFFRGLLFVVPVVATAYIVYVVIVKVDDWIALERYVVLPFPGAGLVLTLAMITLIGFLATNFATRWLFRIADQLFARLPLIKLLYTSLKDLIEAFVGDRKRFDRPVVVSLADGEDAGVLGFLTRDDLTDVGLAGNVAVYVPQSYNFAGNLLIVPSTRVRALDVDARTMMTFIVSGGVSGVESGDTGRAEPSPHPVS